MSRYRKGDLYIRRMKPSDKADSLRTAVQMVYYQVTGRKAYVLLRRGFDDGVMHVASSRIELQRQVFMPGAKSRKWKDIAKKWRVRSEA